MHIFNLHPSFANIENYLPRLKYGVTYHMNAWANYDFSLSSATFSVSEGPYSDSRDTLGHVQLTGDGPHTAFIPEPLQLMFPQVQCGFSFQGGQVNLAVQALKRTTQPQTLFLSWK